MLFSAIWRSNFFIRLRSWEYWPFLVVYWPVLIYWIILSLRARSLFYFSASNPAIENGGMLGESKHSIFDMLPGELIPKTNLVKAGSDDKTVLDLMSHYSYPIICKPDIGERGWKVEKINSDDELLDYNNQINVDYLIQEYLTEEIELGVFYYRYPDKEEGHVSSIVIKEMLHVIGDGSSTLKELILNNDRAKLQWKVLGSRYQQQSEDVIEKGRKFNLVVIGNHCRGTKFLDGSYLINAQLNRVFDSISKKIKGFYFGRFDIKVKSFDDLYSGNIKIMELNGAGSEPAHIYNPGYTIWNAYRVIFHHWHVLYKISRINHKNGVPYMSFRSALTSYKKIKSLKSND